MNKVSIIIPIYNSAKYIEKCAESVLTQTFDDIQYIFVNDSTPDESIECLHKAINRHPDKISHCTLINHPYNKGHAAARNTGLKAATGEYVIFCDSDDWMNPDMIEKLYSSVTANNADIAICDFNMIYQDHTEHYHVPENGNNKIDFIQKYIESVWTVMWNILAKRELYVRHDLHYQEGLRYGEDFDLAIKIVTSAEKIVTIKEPLYNYNRINENSVMHNLNAETATDEQKVYLNAIQYFKTQNIYNTYKKQLCWRVLKSTQEWILDTGTHKFFLEYYPESHQYILSCPYLNIKQKIMMWCLTHHLAPITNSIILLRNIKNGKKA